MKKLTLQELDLKGKKVLMRVDYNVPLRKDGSIADPTRIHASLPSIRHILQAGGSVILMSHLGRPKGTRNTQFSLAPCAKMLSSFLHQPVLMAKDCQGKEVEEMALGLKPGQVLLLENLRFYPAEEDPSTDPNFAKNLAALGEIYVNDAFGTAHRSHSSTATITQFFPEHSAAGLLMQKEISHFETLLLTPKRPFYAIIGGSKISTKIGVLNSLLSKVDALFIAGGMTFTFLKAQGMSIGDSIHEDLFLPQATYLLDQSQKKEIPLYLPEDIVIADRFEERARHYTIPTKQGIPDGWRGMDIGPATMSRWETLLKKGATIFWNGPLGVFEFPPFAKGTEEIARTLAHLHATTIVGGGDSVAAIEELHLSSQFTHLSTGGGASLEWIEFGHLPGIDALSNKM